MTSRYFSKDIAEFIGLLARYKVRYLIVGGEAVIYHGLARNTGDVDFFYDPTPANARRLFRALKAFWNGTIPGVDRSEELLEPRAVFQFGLPPHRIDIMNSISGVAFETAWKTKIADKIIGDSDTVPVYFAGISVLIENKRSVGRLKDLEDVRYLTAAAELAKKAIRPTRKQPSRRRESS